MHASRNVRVWSEPVAYPTYEPLPPDKNPMFLEKRVYQGSSGKVYPLPFIDRVSTEPAEKCWDAIHIENEYLYVMVLPEIGGRIHIGRDKTNGYDFFYRQQVIKPALVGLAGPWISGGVEFNWPQHHRPSTYMPVESFVETEADGSVTVWLSDHDPMTRMKGMHGVCLRPGSSVLELKVRLHNRTEFVQTFLWWANCATRVHEKYQSFFPKDVCYVADHAKRAMSRFPLCEESYYGVPYGERSRTGVPQGETPPSFVPGGEYPANDLSWYANIPVPTSYMAMGSNEDYFGGYDHEKQAGLVHIANHHISPGKKQWTWGNHRFGYAWDKNLTNEDGPYIELMAGVYTDNQPDFSFLQPGETKTFSQCWYPIRAIGPATMANNLGAVSLVRKGNTARIGVHLTSEVRCSVQLVAGDSVVASEDVLISPSEPFVREWPVAVDGAIRLEVRDASGTLLLCDDSSAPEVKPVPEPATEPPLPKDIASNDELFITGLHLDQYRHATRSPIGYWEEALRRDPGDSRCNNALGLYRLRRGEFDLALKHFRTAASRLTRRNPNPHDGEAYFNLGLVLHRLGRLDEAYDAFYKATWNYAWQSAGYFALAQIDSLRGSYDTALEHVDGSLKTNADHLGARNLRALLLQQLGRRHEADVFLAESLALDPLDALARYLHYKGVALDNRTMVDVALELAASGFFASADDLLSQADLDIRDGSAPMVAYLRAYLRHLSGDEEGALELASKGRALDPTYCFPSSLDELHALEWAVSANAGDARAPFYLGNLLYDKKRKAEAIRSWERAVELEPTNSVAWRNLGIAYFNFQGKSAKAKAAYDKALLADPTDARVLFERDQLWKRIGVAPEKRIKELSKHPALVSQRDDLTLELSALLNQTGSPERALELVQTRRFQPWEGGEGVALEQHIRTHLLLGKQALAAGSPELALALFEAAKEIPANIGESLHLLANVSDVHYWIGVAHEQLGDMENATKAWQNALATRGDFQEMSVREFSEKTYFQALAERQLGNEDAATKRLRALSKYADKLAKAEAKIDYFATSLPTMLLFDDDLQARQQTTAIFLKAQANAGLGRKRLAKQGLVEVLERDPNHAMAADLLTELGRPPAR